jgi:hypothetical protein
MAIPKVKAPYSLEAETITMLEQIATRWGVSKSEALRRAIRVAASSERDEVPAAAKLSQLQKGIGLTATVAAAWARQSRSERRAGSRATGKK